MENFAFYSPTYFEFGKGAEEKTGSLAARFGAKKVLLHYGRGSVVKSGLLDRVKKSLNESGIKFAELGGVEPNPRAELVYEGIELARREGVDFIIALGGGSSIDSAKAIGIGVPYKGDFWDFYDGSAAVEKSLPIGVVLTISAAGSEGSEGSVITGGKGKLKRAAGGDVMRPKFAIMNPALTTTLPPFQVACGGADIMAHLFERYFTNTKSVETTDCLIEGLLRAMIVELPKAVANPADYDAQANIMWAGTLAHNNAIGVGRSQDWASHRIEHELSALYGVAHGAGLAVVFPAWMKYVHSHDLARFERLAKNVWGVVDGLAGIEKLKSFWHSLGLPTTLTELGGKAKDVPYLAKNAAYNPDGTLGGFVPLNKADVAAVYALMK